MKGAYSPVPEPQLRDVTMDKECVFFIPQFHQKNPLNPIRKLTILSLLSCLVATLFPSRIIFLPMTSSLTWNELVHH